MRRSILSWQLYDFADTIYSMNVYTRYFGLFLAAHFAQGATAFGWALTGANLLVALSSPLLGALSDASQRRLPFLRAFVLLTAGSTAIIGLAPNYIGAILLFTLSYIGYQSASTFYQALLPGITTPQNLSRVSGGGVAVGYIGTIAGVAATSLFIHSEADYELAFPVSAVLYLLAALPCLLWVPDFAPATERLRLDLRVAYHRTMETFRNARSYPGLFGFLVTDFLYENAVAASTSFMAIYATKVIGFGEADLSLFVIFSTVFAVIWSFIYGPIVDRIGPKRGTLIALCFWLVAMPAVVLSRTPEQLRLVGPLVGVALASVWIGSRSYLVALAPVQKSGEFFGLYSLSGKSAGVLGTGVWTLVLWLLTERIGEALAMKAAVWVMWSFIVIGIIGVLRLPDRRPTAANVLERGA